MVQLTVKSSSSENAKGFVYSDQLDKDRESKKRFCLNKFEEFCKRTDLHGYKYIVMEDYNIVERFGWAVAVFLSIGFAAYFVVTAYRWYAKNPIVTVIESTQGAIWDVPFPAVTVCDLNIVSKRAARQLADNLTLPENVTADFIYGTFRLVPLLYSTFFAEPEEKEHLKTLQNVLDDNNITIEALVLKLSPAATCNNLIQRCMWKNAIYRCEDIFKPIFTLLSLCCTFNYFAVEDHSTAMTSEGLPSMSPRRVAACGYQTALTALLYTDPEDYYSATVASQGALVIIDNAYNIPDLDSPVRMVNPATEVLIALSPERTYTTAGIKAVTPEQRQCYYYDEIQISRFRQYSFHNCMAYQKIEIVKKGCGCIPVSYPKEGSEEVARNLSRYGHVIQCLPECEHYDYPLEVALGRLAENIYVNGLPFFVDVNLQNRSLLNVFFNDLVSTRYRRDVYLNWQNILAAFGGLLSLMLGFTLISGFDLILFFTVRIAYDCFQTMAPRKKTPKKIHVKEFHKKDSWMEQTLYPREHKENSFEKTKSGSYEYLKY
ncbi:sodium channel protein Nach-like isoform X2 [Trichoplusia ni]|uniref:Sodium channel protein Nach-like isoform X2 n=1 Tax=Trichoplusia ni TaxID=7111 RepID=A0A7E5VPA7_TRINI|nr:sodium channel protein Nach-like isoform X2 [Trichoplusia ni]